MRLLFVVEDLTGTINATRNAAMTVARGLAARGNEIAVAGLARQGIAPERALYEGIRVFPFAYPARDEGVKLLASGASRAKKLCSAMGNPLEGCYLLRRFYAPEAERRCVTRRLLHGLRALCAAERFDWIIAVTEPYETALAALQVRGARLGLYQLDPHAYNEAKPAAARALRFEQEQRVLCAAKAVFVTPEILAEDAAGRPPEAAPLAPYTARMTALELPCLVEQTALPPLPPEVEQSFLHDGIQLCFCGGIYGGVRSPAFLIRLLERLGPGFHLHVFGSVEAGACAALEASERVTLHGLVPRGEALAAMRRADILVNLGNTMTNQVPSKVLDYLSAGKPILNLYKTERCPTLRLLKPYPLALSVCAGEEREQDVVQAVRDFCTAQQGKTIGFSEVRSLYGSFAPDDVTERMEERLRKPLLR